MFRAARPEEAGPLRDLERAANLVALAHVFPPERYPFPDDDVLTRWSLLLDDPEVCVRVAEDDQGLTCLVAYDAGTLRHLAVRPDHWGRGLASAGVRRAVEAIAARGSRVAGLWCLEENHRARRVYEHLGWEPAAERREAPWPPYPTEMRYERAVP
ncbi:MAG: GNAT family N-acetyltransferase [Nocardioidaceae bacterium]